MYQALRLYVNGFQPSMKLQAKQYDGRKVRRVYDAAKTPLQRLLLSQVLSASKKHELLRVAQVLDPLRLFHHPQDLQQALFGPTSVSPDAEGTSPVAVLPFCVERRLAGFGTAVAEIVEESWQEQEIHTAVPEPVSANQPEQEADRHTPSTRTSACSSPVIPSQQTVQESSFPSQPTAEEATMSCGAAPSSSVPSVGQPQASLAPASSKRSRQKPSDMTIEQAVQDYLEDQRSHHRRPKTLQWHQQVLGLFQHYLLTQHHCLLLRQITEAEVRGWLAFLPQMPTARGSLRLTSTVESYARSARAFCQWLVRYKYHQATPFAHLLLPKVENRLLRPLDPEEWEQLLLACHPPKEVGMLAERATARNRAILWVLFDTGMRVSEVCALRLVDVGRKQGILRVWGKGPQEQRLTLGSEELHHLLAYLDEYRLVEAECFERGGAGEDHLFLSETCLPLTKSGMALLFGRLRRRAGITRKGVNPSLLRESFAVRYLRAGGDLCALRALLGQKESASVNSSQRMSAGGKENEKRKGHPEGH